MKCTIKEINKLVEQVRAGRPPQLPEGKREMHHHDPALPGFYIRLLDTGVASWTVQWKSFGRQKKIALGNVRIVDRPDAVTAGRKLLAKVTLDRLDPHEARRERMRAAKVTYEIAAQAFLMHRQTDLRAGTYRNWKRYLTTGFYLRPLQKLPLDEITKEQLQTQIDKIAIQSGNMAALTCCTALGVFFKWAIQTGKLPRDHHNPMTYLQLPARHKARGRVLINDEIQLIWKACEAWEAEVIRDQQSRASGGKPIRRGPLSITDFSVAVRLLFLTGCRAQEIGDLQRSELDLDNGEIKIPAERTKNKRILLNPLSDWAVQILRAVKQRPGTDSMFGHVNRPGKGQNLANVQKKINKFIVRTGGTPPKDWRVHDIRRTFRTRLAALGVTKDVAEALLGHGGHRTELENTYDLYERWPEKRQALAKWEANLRAIIDGTAEKIAAPRFGERRKKEA